MLLYTDPRDDGVVTVSNGYAPYPAGPARNPTSVQRGSVQYLSIYPSDPTTREFLDSMYTSLRLTPSC